MADHLCVNCSICCNGTLFKRVPITQPEIDQLGGQGDFFTKSDGSLRMRLRCRHLGDDGACKVYEARPKTCRTYKCRLLKRVESGEISESHAVEIVREIRSAEKIARARISRALGEDIIANSTDTVHTAKARLPAKPGVEQEQDVAHANLVYGHFVDLLRLHLKPSFRS